ncbi:MAG: tetratricopeptide repeat protein [Acidobacteria bacterium]|nr:tetratricopeptide repeat protein [Acidobacteriota bacterium]
MRSLRILSLLVLAGLQAAGDVAAGENYELTGRIEYEDGRFSPGATPLVMLEGITKPFAAHTWADLSGKFRFKKLPPDRYTLIVSMERVGEWQQTVEVSPGLADSRKRIFVEVVFRPQSRSGTFGGVSAAELSVPEKARKEFEKAYRRLGKKDLEGAVAHLERSVELAPRFVSAWNTLGTLAFKSGEFALAESRFREALKHDPGYYPALVNLGGALLSQNRIQESLQANLAAVRERPDDALAHSQLGLSCYFLKRPEEAARHLERAIALDPAHFSFPQLPLADIYLQMKDTVSAARVLRQFLALHPDSAQAPAVRKQLGAIGFQVRD